MCDDPPVVQVSEQLVGNNPSSVSSSRGVPVPGLLETWTGRRSQAGTSAKLLSAIMRGQWWQINAQVLMVHLFSLLQGTTGGEGGAAAQLQTEILAGCQQAGFPSR